MSHYPSTVESLPLFARRGDAGRYPNQPGAKVGGTSQEAATAVAGDANRTRAAALAELRKVGPMTPDEVAERLGRSVLSIRPRISELVTKGLVYATGARRKNASGHGANVYAAKGAGPTQPP